MMRTCQGALCAVFLVACDAGPQRPSCTIDVVLAAPASDELVVKSIAVLRKRVREFSGEDVQASREDDKIVLTLRQCPDDSALLQKLLSAPGRFRIGLVGTTWLTEADVAEANMALDFGGNDHVVAFLFTKDAAARFARLTAEAVGMEMEIEWDGKVLARPILQSAIATGSGQIGPVTADESQLMAAALRSGPMPVRIHSVQIRAPAVEND